MTLSEVLIWGRERMKMEMKFPTSPGSATTTNNTKLITNSNKGK